MKIKKLSIAIMAILVIGFVFIITGCEKEKEINSKSTLSDTEIDLIADIGAQEFNLENAYQENRITEKEFYIYKKLDEEELVLYLDKVAQKRSIFLESDFKSEGRERNQIYLFEYNKMLATNEASKEVFDKQYNEITYDQEIDLIDNYFDIIESNLKNKLLMLEDKSILHHWNSTINDDSPQFKSVCSCPENSYYINTNQSSSYTKDCIGYEDATYPGDTDCDYEFRFDWTDPYTPYQLSLRGTSWSVRRVLDLGGIKGRVVFSDDEVRFLIGKGRITLSGYSVSGFSSRLKGDW